MVTPPEGQTVHSQMSVVGTVIDTAASAYGYSVLQVQAAKTTFHFADRVAVHRSFAVLLLGVLS